MTCIKQHLNPYTDLALGPDQSYIYERQTLRTLVHILCEGEAFLLFLRAPLKLISIIILLPLKPMHVI